MEAGDEMKSVVMTKAELLRELEETRKRVQDLDICRAEFEKAREKYEKVLDSAPDATLFVNTQNQVVLVNAQFEKIFGYRQEEIIGKSLEALVPDRYKKNHRQMVEKFFLQPKVRPMGSHLEIYAKKKTGMNSLWISV